MPLGNVNICCYYLLSLPGGGAASIVSAVDPGLLGGGLEDAEVLVALIVGDAASQPSNITR